MDKKKVGGYENGIYFVKSFFINYYLFYSEKTKE